LYGFPTLKGGTFPKGNRGKLQVLFKQEKPEKDNNKVNKRTVIKKNKKGVAFLYKTD
jgi:hypothetical protein